MKKIQKVYLISSLLGVLLLLFLTSLVHPKEISICELNKTKNNEKILIRGIISDNNVLADNFNLITLEDSSCKVKVVCNCKISLLNKKVAVIGRVRIHKNEKQISADRIEELL